MRLIYAEEAEKEFNIHYGSVHDAVIAKKLLDTIPTIDAVPVVRCKDCKHWGEHDVKVSGETDKIKACGWAIWMVGENGYCVFGERRDEA